MKQIGKYIGIGALCLVAGFATGKKTSEIDSITVHAGTPFYRTHTDPEALRLHKPFGKDEVFVKNPHKNVDTYERLEYFGTESTMHDGNRMHEHEIDRMREGVLEKVGLLE